MAQHDWETVRYGEHPDQWIQRWDPVREPVGSAVVLHGGYWRHRYGLDLMNPLAAHLARRDWQAWNVEYRRVEESDAGLAESPWHRMSADILDVLATVSASAAAPVVVVGHSAGGQFALWSGAASAVPDAVVALAPVTDLHEADRRSLSDGAVRELLGGDHREVPDRYADASPIGRVPLGVPQLVGSHSVWRSIDSWLERSLLSM